MLSIKKTGDLNFKSLDDLINKGKLTEELVDIAYNHFIESFPTTISDNGGGETDNSASGWLKRKEKEDYPALNKTGKLIKSIKKGKGKIYSNLDYAAYQNNGGGWLPKREFIGPSKELNQKSLKHIKSRITKILKQ